jgi:5-methyltetrahydropteroyltriglutamate--homocysteine methyltransferase
MAKLKAGNKNYINSTLERSMGLLTTTIGAYPKPDYVPIPDWFQEEDTVSKDPTKALDSCTWCYGDEAEALLDRATREVVEEQVRIGIDVPTDGEVRRENYIHYHCRQLRGIDFSRLTRKSMRSGKWVVSVPTIVGPVRSENQFLIRDWQVAQSFTERPVKITVPGPMTIADSLADEYYGDERRLGRDLAKALNAEILALAEAGCRWIQVDEPLFARETALLEYPRK